MPGTSPRWQRALGPVTWVPAALVMLPLGVLLVEALGQPEVIWEFLGDARRRSSWLMSLRVAGGAGCFSALLAAPLSILLVRTDVRGANALNALTRLPLALPAYLLAMAWLHLWAPRSGLMSGLGLGWDLSTPLGCSLILGLEGLPLVMMPLQAQLSRADPALEEAARLCGASPGRALWDATLRPAIPALCTGVALAMAASLAAFGVPLLLGSAGASPFSVLTTHIYEQILVGTPRARQDATAAAVWLGVTSSLASLLAVWAARNVSPAPMGKPGRPRLLSLGRARNVLSAVCWLAVVGLLVAPLLALALASLQPLSGASGLSLDAHLSLFTRRGMLTTVGRSTLLSLGAATVCVMTAVVLAMLAERRRQRSAAWAATVMSWPYLLPGSVLALGMLLTFSRPISLILFERVTLVFLLAGTTWMLWVAYILKHLAVAIRPVGVALKGIGTSLDEAARMSGAGPWLAFTTGTARALSPTLTATFVTVFLLCFSELTLSVLLVGADMEVVGTVLFELHSYASPAESAALATWMTCVALLGFATVGRQR